MTNHIHLIAVPEREDSLAVLLRRVHGRYDRVSRSGLVAQGVRWRGLGADPGRFGPGPGRVAEALHLRGAAVRR